MCRVDWARYRPAVSASTIRTLRTVTVVAEELRGFIPRVLRFDDVFAASSCRSRPSCIGSNTSL